MCYEQAANRIHEKSKRIGLSYDYIAAQLNLSGETVRNLAIKKTGMLYTFLDVISELNLELRLDDQVIQCHQDILDYILKTRVDVGRLSTKSSVKKREVINLYEGENLRIESFFRIIESLGIEARLI